MYIMISYPNKIIIFFVFAASFLSLSPVFNYFFSFPSNLLSVISCLIVLSVLFGVELNKGRVIFSFFVSIYFFVASFFLALYWQELKLAIYPIYVIVALFSVFFIPLSVLRELIDFLSVVLVVVVVGAIIGFLYALIGGDEMLSFLNPDGRVAKLYLTTMTNAISGNVIRPSGIFDEPGALSFVICIVCSCRHMLNMSKSKTWFLLISGFITMSLAHFVYVLCHIVSEKIKIGDLSRNILILISLIILLLSQVDVLDAFNDNFLARFDIENGRLAGDSRSDLLFNAYELLNERVFLWGVDSSCVVNIDVCNGSYKLFGENFLSLLVLLGIGLSLPYYLCLIIFTVLGLTKKNRFVLFGIALLLCQRPYLMSYGYAVLIVLLLSVAFYDDEQNREVENKESNI